MQQENKQGHNIGVFPSPVLNQRQGFSFFGTRGNHSLSHSSSTNLFRAQNNKIKSLLMMHTTPTWEGICMPQELREHATILAQHFV
jgi:hypothetical protein